MTFRGDCEAEVVALDDDAITDAVEELAVELEEFAFGRERVLAKLDIRSASLARRTARELRLVVARIACANRASEERARTVDTPMPDRGRDVVPPEAGMPLADQAARDVGSDQLGDLLGRAHTLLEGERHEAPGRPSEGDPPMPSSRDAKTTTPPISDIRQNSREELELDYEDLGATMPDDAAGNPELVAILRGKHPNQRPTAPALTALTAAAVRRALTESSGLLPYFGDEDGENDFDDETVARKVAWERSGNRVLGR